MSYPRPTLPPARSEAVRRNPNLLTWLRHADDQVTINNDQTNQNNLPRPAPPTLAPPSSAQAIIRQVKEWDAGPGPDPQERQYLIRLALLTSTKILVRVDRTANNPHFRPKAGDFYGLRIVYSVVPKAEEGSDQQCHEGEADVTVHREEGRWHGVAELAIPSNMGRGYETFAKIVRAI